MIHILREAGKISCSVMEMYETCFSVMFVVDAKKKPLHELTSILFGTLHPEDTNCVVEKINGRYDHGKCALPNSWAFFRYYCLLEVTITILKRIVI